MDLCSETIAGRKATVRLASKSLTILVPMESHGVKYRHSHVADVILQIGWEITCLSDEYLLSSL